MTHRSAASLISVAALLAAHPAGAATVTDAVLTSGPGGVANSAAMAGVALLMAVIGRGGAL